MCVPVEAHRAFLKDVEARAKVILKVISFYIGLYSSFTSKWLRV